MKKIIATFLILGSMSSFSTEIETLFTCEQEDGDQWIEVGVAMNDGPGLQLIAVEHQDDDVTVNLLKAVQVFKQDCNGQECYVDAMDTIKLISKKGSFEYADFYMLEDGPQSISEEGMPCFKKGSIKYNSQL